MVDRTFFLTQSDNSFVTDGYLVIFCCLIFSPTYGYSLVRYAKFHSSVVHIKIQTPTYSSVFPDEGPEVGLDWIIYTEIVRDLLLNNDTLYLYKPTLLG